MTEQHIKRATPQQVKEWLDQNKAILIDVRDETEYQQEHIPDAHLYPLTSFSPFRIAEEANGHKVVFHCLSGKRAKQAGQQYMEKTNQSAYCLIGDLKGWKDAGFSTRSARSGISLERQVMIVAGSIVLSATLLGMFLASIWLWLAAFVGAGLLFAGLSGSCMLKKLLMLLPYNAKAVG